MLNFDKIKNTIFELVESKVELKKVEIQDKIENTITDVTYQVIKIALISIIMIFALILLSIGINAYFVSDYVGYLSVLGLILIALLIFIWKKDFFKSKIELKVDEKLNHLFTKKPKS